MKNFVLAAFRLMFLGAALLPAAPAQAHASHAGNLLPVTIQVTGLKSDEGQLLFAIFNDADGFPNDATPVKTLVIKDITSSTMSATVELPAGTYAVSFIADKNGDGKLDTGLFGIPSEGFGFSNNPKITFGAPSFEKCAVDIESAHQTISIKTDYL